MTVLGHGLDDTRAVLFGARLAVRFEVVDPYTLVAVTPPGPCGPVPVRVATEYAQLTLEAGYTYVEPLQVAALEPHVGPMDGGTEVTLTGCGLVAGTTPVTCSWVGIDSSKRAPSKKAARSRPLSPAFRQSDGL